MHQAVDVESESAFLELEEDVPQTPERSHRDLPPEPPSQQFHVQEPIDDNFDDGIYFD